MTTSTPTTWSRVLAPALLTLFLALPSAAQDGESDAAEAPEATSSESTDSDRAIRAPDATTDGDRRWAGQAVAPASPRYDAANDQYVYPTGTRVRGTDPSGERGTVNEKGDIVYSDGTRVVHDPVTGAVTYVHPDGSSTQQGGVTYNSARNVFAYEDGPLVSGTDPEGNRAKVNQKGDVVGSDGTIITYAADTGEVTYVAPNGDATVRDSRGNRIGSYSSTQPRYDAEADTFVFPDGSRVRATDPTGRRGTVNEKGDVVYADGTIVTRNRKGGVNVISPDGTTEHRGETSGHGRTQSGRTHLHDPVTGASVWFEPGESSEVEGDPKYNPETGRYDHPDGSSSDTPNGRSQPASAGSGSEKSGGAGRDRQERNEARNDSKQDKDSKDKDSKDKDDKDKESKSASKDKDDKAKSDGGSKGYTPMAGMQNGGRRPVGWSRTDSLCNQKGRFSTRCPGAASQPGEQGQGTASAGPVLGLQSGKRGGGGKGVVVPQAPQQGGKKKTLNAKKGWTIDPGELARAPKTRGRKPSDKQGWAVDPGEQSQPKRRISEEELERRIEERRNWAKGGREGF